MKIAIVALQVIAGLSLCLGLIPAYFTVIGFLSSNYASLGWACLLFTAPFGALHLGL